MDDRAESQSSRIELSVKEMLTTVLPDQQRLRLAVDPNKQRLMVDNSHEQRCSLPAILVLQLAVARKKGLVQPIRQAAHRIRDRTTRLEEGCRQLAQRLIQHFIAQAYCIRRPKLDNQAVFLAPACGTFPRRSGT